MLRQLIAVTAVGVLSAGSVQAQAPRGLREVPRNAREGFWIGFGLGGGSTGADCASCGSGRTGGVSGYLRLGGTLSQHVLLGGESDGWFRRKNGVDIGMAFASFIASIYPSAEGAFFFQLGIGGMSYTEDDGIDKLTAEAPSAGIGVGYDFRVGRMLSVTPFFNALASSPVSYRINGVKVSAGEDVRLNLVHLGVGLTWH